ncbi:MAG: hypothetical protein ACI9ZT_001420 [Gammaproteobacteria bacterium]|jgi:hypothetical protein
MSIGAAEIMSEPVRLKYGSYLYIRDDGTMRVVSENNKLISIKDGAELELVDGQLITMKNKKIEHPYYLKRKKWRYKYQLNKK